MRRLASIASFLAALAVQTGAWAQIELDSHFTGDDEPTIDARLDEWSDENGRPLVTFVPLGAEDRVGGEGELEGETDIHVELGIANSAKALYAAFRVVDQRFVRTKALSRAEDHLELWFAAPDKADGVKAFGIGVFADPSRYKGPVEIRWLSAGAEKAAGKVAGAKGAVAGDETTYDIEISIPWSALPGKAAARDDLGLAVYAIDGDMAAHLSQKNILGTAPLEAIDDPRSIPHLVRGDLGGGLAAFTGAMGLGDEPARFTKSVDLAGGKEREDVHVVGGYLVAMGGAVGGANAYVYTRLPVKDVEQVTALETAQLLGDGRSALIVEYREETGGVAREWFEIYRVGPEQAFEKLFGAATLVRSGQVSIANTYRFVAGPEKAKAIEVKAGAVSGVDENTIGDGVPEEGGNPMVMPWDDPPRVRYVFADGAYRRP